MFVAAHIIASLVVLNTKQLPNQISGTHIYRIALVSYQQSVNNTKFNFNTMKRKLKFPDLKVEY